MPDDATKDEKAAAREADDYNKAVAKAQAKDAAYEKDKARQQGGKGKR